MDHGNRVYHRKKRLLFMTTLTILFSLIGRSFQACPPFTICTDRHGTIIQENNMTLDKNNPMNAGRSWFIKMDTVGSVLLHFKSFHDHGNSIAAFAYKDQQLTDARIFYRKQGGFQVLLDDCDFLVLYLPIYNSVVPTFELEYFWGCGVMRNDQRELIYKGATNDVEEKQHACWFVEPDDDTAAIYLSAFDVRLEDDQTLKVWDLASKDELLKMNARDEYLGLTGIRYLRSQPLIVEIKCNKSSSSSCSVARSHFTIRHQVLQQKDLDCLQQRNNCEGTDDCQMSQCSAFDKLLWNQYGIGESHTSTRSGGVRRPKRLGKKCQLARKYCTCPLKLDKRVFCSPKISCRPAFFAWKKIPAGCLWTCIYAKIMECPPMQLHSKIL